MPNTPGRQVLNSVLLSVSDTEPSPCFRQEGRHLSSSRLEISKQIQSSQLDEDWLRQLALRFLLSSILIEAPGREPGHLMVFVSIDTLLILFFQIRLSCVGGSKEEY